MFSSPPAVLRALSRLSGQSLATAWTLSYVSWGARLALTSLLESSAGLRSRQCCYLEPSQHASLKPPQAAQLHSLKTLSCGAQRPESHSQRRAASKTTAVSKPTVQQPLAQVQAWPHSITKPQKTDDEHPCGEGKNEWPFYAKAFYVGKEIKHRVGELLESAEEHGYPRVWSKENPLICLSPMAKLTERSGPTGLPCASYVIAFDRMESVVFINGDGKEKQIWNALTGGQLTTRYTEEYKVSVMPDIDGDLHAADCIVLERAEFNNIRTLAYVLAQTVALHFYETYANCAPTGQLGDFKRLVHLGRRRDAWQVDRTLGKFEDMNTEMERSSSFRPAMSKEELLQMVARNNLLFTAIISKLAVMERFDVAWKNPDCNKVYEHLLQELEVKDRYENLQLKLNMVQDNFRYFLELLQNQKSDLLEWIIIILIGGEITLNLYELFLK